MGKDHSLLSRDDRNEVCNNKVAIEQQQQQQRDTDQSSESDNHDNESNKEGEDQVANDTVPEHHQYRVCIVGSEGVDKTTTTAVFIRILPVLQMGRSVVYHIKTDD